MANVTSLRDLLQKYNNYSAEMRWNDSPDELYEPFRYMMNQSGKKIRPLSLLLSSSFFNSNFNTALPIAYALELFHNFTLIHDDIMDSAEIRRGNPSAHNHFGNNAALLSGDAMLLESCKIIQKNTHHTPDVMEVFLTTGLDVCKGQSLDMSFESREMITIPEYIEMIRLKTSVLLGAAMKIGAMINTAEHSTQEQLYQLGIDLGIAFQIQDDILDCYGNEFDFGKKKAGDLIQKKKSILILCALENLNENEKLKFIQNYNLPRSDSEQRDTFMEYFALHGIRDKAEDLYNSYKELCFASIEQLKISEDHKLLLEEFVYLIINRTV